MRYPKWTMLNQWFVEESPNVLSCGLPYYGLKVTDRGLAELVNGGVSLQKSQGLHLSHSRNLLDQR